MPLKGAVNDAIKGFEGGRNLHLYGKNAEGVFYYIKQHFPEKILDTKFDIIPKEERSNHIIAIRAKDLDILKNSVGEALEKNPKLIVIDEEMVMKVNSKENDKYLCLKQKEFYTMQAKFYLKRESNYDIDIGIRDAVAHLYLDVFDAYVDYENDGEKPYFRTSEIIEYSRSRPILEGIILSAFKKFPNAEIIASRGIPKRNEHDDVRMFELAEIIAKDLKIDSVKVEEAKKEDPSWKGDYIIRKNLEGKKVVVLDDVLMTGKTIESIKKAVNDSNGNYINTIVLMDRSEKLFSDVYALTTLKRFLELKKERDNKNKFYLMSRFKN